MSRYNKGFKWQRRRELYYWLVEKPYLRRRYSYCPGKHDLAFYMVSDKPAWHRWWLRYGPGYLHSRLKCRLVLVGHIMWVRPGDDRMWSTPLVLIYYLDGPAKTW